jgi:hypothetical protein
MVLSVIAFNSLLTMLHIQSFGGRTTDNEQADRRHLTPDWPFDANYTRDVGYDPEIIDHVRKKVLITSQQEKIGKNQKHDDQAADYSTKNFTSIWLVPRLFQGIVVRMFRFS